MMKLSINKSKTFLPLSMAKGTTEQRLQKARLLNLKFYDNLHDEFINREVKQSVFKRVLREASGIKPEINIFEANDWKKTTLTPLLDSRRKVKGFAFFIPLTYWYSNIPQSASQFFLKETQRFFNMICNPKFLTRRFLLFNRGYNIKKVMDFYSQNIAEKQVLTAENLDKFLCGKNADEKINTLQFLRYNLMDDMNVHKAEYRIDKHIEKVESLKFQNKNYDLSEYQYDEKLALLNQRLNEVIQAERKGIKK